MLYKYNEFGVHRQKSGARTSHINRIGQSTETVETGSDTIIPPVFPDARFILALRHPCDCVLSCYMHLFGPNDAMANFYTLEDTADVYARVMGLWRSWAAQLPLRYHTIHYENVVQDLPGEVKPLLDFLGLDWQEHMARPHEHAARREFINTPSRSQVIQPLYQRAAGRWRRYQPFMEKILPVLQPYIEYFGYAPRG